jgi:hypothetical protein
LAQKTSTFAGLQKWGTPPSFLQKMVDFVWFDCNRLGDYVWTCPCTMRCFSPWVFRASLSYLVSHVRSVQHSKVCWRCGYGMVWVNFGYRNNSMVNAENQLKFVVSLRPLISTHSHVFVSSLHGCRACQAHGGFCTVWLSDAERKKMSDFRFHGHNSIIKGDLWLEAGSN